MSNFSNKPLSYNAQDSSTCFITAYFQKISDFELKQCIINSQHEEYG